MKTSLQWLNRYLDKPIEAQELERLLTSQGLVIEAAQQVAGDTIVDVEITSNRSDCQSHVGLAREVAAGSERRFLWPDCELPPCYPSSEKVAALTSVENHAADLCPVYTARVIRAVKIAPSPPWLASCLEAIGLRSVNNVVDITNFVLFELGQPLHAFDLVRLNEQRIIVRHAVEGEKFTAIDGSQHTLTHNMLIIGDASHPVAVAGVMGGVESEVTDASTDILLESALFDPLSTRQTSRALKLSSDSSFRFERGVDPVGIERASRRAAKLIVELAGGELAEGVIRVGCDQPQPWRITMNIERCCRLIGVRIETQRIVEMLDRLLLEPKLDRQEQVVTCTIPTYRLDLIREVDLIEEAARLWGLENLPVQPRIHIVAQPLCPTVAARQKIGQVLTAHGYHESITFSFISPRLASPFLRDGEEAVMIDDDRRTADPMLRPAILPSLLAARKTNQDAGAAHVALYETASAWVRQNGRIVERQLLGLLLDAPDVASGLRAIRGTVDELYQQLLGDIKIQHHPATGKWFSDGLSISGNTQATGQVAILGIIHPDVADLFDLQVPVVLAELALNVLIEGYPPQRTINPLPRFPGIQRDLSVVVDETITWQQIRGHIAKPALLERIKFLGIYRGKPITLNKKSVSFRMFFRDPDRTLRHEQVDPQVRAVVERLTEQVGAQLRG